MQLLNLMINCEALHGMQPIKRKMIGKNSSDLNK